MSTNLENFVKQTIAEIDNYDKEHLKCIRQVVAKAIDFYKFKSYERMEETVQGLVPFIYIYSMAEENLLSKIAGFAAGSDRDFDIEEVYEGRVIREY
ncbi:DUF6407 family protein [Ectobacillus antri]|uniref:DUF6407 family protein n=1 Tax=Ectobacillus antri TaxID=2486280 RepID=A0ABT6H4R3_9BACI|nr:MULTISPECIES: DUF6407 family protein [Ectobacillus]MDG4657299.1 DUF6407 family protein [Ectobacillus antri]MDG5754349.1 DUF6407 family protein [Ectobacillus antri]UOY91720.1 DUF6407 family protein [Ectobacillus sp. JY-23]